MSAMPSTSPSRIVAAAVIFARENNVRLVIRNTGHDYLGRSTGAGALCIWTHYLKTITPTQWNSSKFVGTALKIGAGVQEFELVETAAVFGRVATSGECPIVGVAGGYNQNDGHFALSTSFGLGADQTFSFEVVMASGDLVTASRSENTDLYWALSGAGGGTCAVTVWMTIKTYPDAVVSKLKLSILSSDNGNSSDTVFAAVEAFHAALPDIVDFGTMVIYYLTSEYLTISALTAFNETQNELGCAMQTMLDSFDALELGFMLDYTESDTYLEHYEYYWELLPDGWIQVGTDQLGGRLISSSQLANFSSASRGIANNGGVLIGVGTSIAPFGGDNAVLPAWRDAIVAASIEAPFSVTDPWSDVFEEQNLIADVLQPIMEEASPCHGHLHQ